MLFYNVPISHSILAIYLTLVRLLAH